MKTTSNIDIEIGLMNLEKQVSDTGTRVWKRTTRANMFIIPMLMVLLITYYGYKLATTKCTKDNISVDSYIAFVFGILTMIFGFIYLIVGITILVELAFDLFSGFRRDDVKTSQNEVQFISGNYSPEEQEQMTSCEMFISSLAVMVLMFMLTWAIYQGYKLATEAHEVVIYSQLPFLIGVITMAFGFIYFLNGIGLLAQSVLNLSGRLRHVVAKVMLSWTDRRK